MYAAGFEGALVLGNSLTTSQLQAYNQALADLNAAIQNALPSEAAATLVAYSGNSAGDVPTQTLNICEQLLNAANETTSGSPAEQVKDNWGLIQINSQGWTGPVITAWPTNETVDANLNFTMTVTATGPNLTYQWYLNGVEIPGATGASYTISDAQPSDSGSYYVVVTNKGGSMISPVAIVTVEETPPVITSSPSNETLNAGSSFTLTVTATGPNLTYQWYLNGDKISGATGASYTVSGAQPSDAGGYLVVVTNSGGSTTSAVATVAVQPVTTSLTGTWTGSWSEPNVGGDFCDYETWSMTWKLTQSGSSISGTYTMKVSNESGFCPDDVGDTESGELVQGTLSGTSFTIFTDEGTEFTGTVIGSTITGVGDDGSSSDAGKFSLQGP